MQLFATTMVPSQGFFNGLIYFSSADQGRKRSQQLSNEATTARGLSAWWNKSREHGPSKNTGDESEVIDDKKQAQDKESKYGLKELPDEGSIYSA